MKRRRQQQPRRRRPKTTGQPAAGRDSTPPGHNGYRDRPRPEFKPRINSRLKPILQEIGVPEETPFTPDPFQIEALEKLKDKDVIVSAPTGSGKTYIAVQAMDEVLARGGRTWYASPLKALSNSKFIEFGRRFGPETVGLLTGDHKVNPDAPLIVGTTEILRNQLYDAMTRGENFAADLVVMDEAHYLGDPDRGVVWEESLIYLPARVRLLLLSATVANAVQLADWLATIRGAPATAVLSRERPVPLHPLFLFPDGELVSLNQRRGLAPQVRHFVEQRPQRSQRRGETVPPFSRILRVLYEADLLPAIFFLKSRSDCDLALSRCFTFRDYVDPEIADRRDQRLDELLERHPFLKNHGHLKYIRGPGVAAHHAGHLPHWKMVVEHLMQEGLLTAIFSTSTVAAGVNFPARTVVLSQSDRFNGREFVDLTATELLQMTGRAGRRGMDRIGFALVVPGPFQNVKLVQSLLGAPPDPVYSQIQINFSMVLNLLLSQKPDQIKEMLTRSLASFQQDRSFENEEISGILARLEPLLGGGRCRGPEEAVILSDKSRRLLLEAERLSSLRPWTAWEAGLRTGLVPGRLFEVYSGKMLCALAREDRRGRPGVMAAKLKDDLGLKKGQIRQKWVPLDRISGLLDKVLEIDLENAPLEAVRTIRQAAHEDYRVLELEEMPEDPADTALAQLDGHLSRTREELDLLPCSTCPIFIPCQGGDSEAGRLLKRLRRLSADNQASSRMLWSSFLRRLDFLKSEGFVNEDDEPTEDGQWASQLRLDHPLLIAAGIRAQAFPKHDPTLLAAVAAPFVLDRELTGEGPSVKAPPKLASAWFKLETSVEPMLRRQSAAGYETPILKLRPALAIHAWASGEDWETCVNLYGQDEGDMAMLVFRTADNLRQMAGLKDTHGDLAATARQAVDMILREPVIAPL